MPDLRLGFHVSISGGISNSVGNAEKLGCTAFQIFSRNPRGWAAKPLDPADVESFKNRLAQSKISSESVAVHMPYLPNLSGPPGESYKRSRQTLREEVERCRALGIKYLIIHLGSHLGAGRVQGIAQLSAAVSDALSRQGKGGNVAVLLENNAGQKNAVGTSFEELANILDAVPSKKQIGFCLDTCHLFASGHDLRDGPAVSSVFDAFDDAIGVEKIKVIHLNDSKGDLGSNLDRHEHLGCGRIGAKGIAAVLNHPVVRRLPVIMETPVEDGMDEQNMKFARGLSR